MSTSFPQTDGTPPRFRVAVIPRLVTALSYSMAALGAALSAFLLYRVLEAMREAETAGIGAVTGGISEASVPVLVGLYLAVGGGFIATIIVGARLIVDTTTASPPAWFYLIVAALSFLPVGLLWGAGSTLIQALYPGSGGIVEVAATIRGLVYATMITGPLSALLLFITSVLPFKSKSQTHWPGIIILVALQIFLIAATVAFHMRLSGLWRVMEAESFG